MKGTFLFLTMLIFVSASNDLLSPEVDPALLELSKDPQTEAVFATMHVTLQTEGGFHRVMGLLNELVTDSKEQLHSMTKLWRGVKVRCQVSKVKLNGRQEFFQTYYNQIKRNANQYKQRLAELRDHLAAIAKSRKVYGAVLAGEVARHKAQRDLLQRRHGHAKSGLASLAKARAAVKNWTPKGRALIQAHLHDVSESYLQVKEYELPQISEFLERTTDNKVRRRLLEWIDKVQSHLDSARRGFEEGMRNLRSIGMKVEKALNRMLNNLKQATQHIRNAINWATNMGAQMVRAMAYYSNLRKQNAGLIKANNAFCALEARNFNTNQAKSRSAIRMFREVRTYFVNHYSRIHSFIKAKYHKY